MPRQIKTPGEQPAPEPVQPVAPEQPAPEPAKPAPAPAATGRPVLTPDGWVV